MSCSVYVLAPAELTQLHLEKPTDTKALLLKDGDTTELVIGGGKCGGTVVADGGAGKLVVAKGAGPQGPPGPVAWEPEFCYVLTAADIANGNFALPDEPAPFSLFLFLNGLYQSKGLDADYTIANNVITWNPAYSLIANEDFYTARYQV